MTGRPKKATTENSPYKEVNGHLRIANHYRKSSNVNVLLEHVNFYLYTISNPTTGKYLTAANFADVTTSILKVFIAHR